MRNKTIYSRAALAALALPMLAGALAGCGQKGGAPGPGGGAGKNKGPQPVTVQVTPVTLGTIAQTQPVTGAIAALEDSTVSARVSARVSAVYVREGDPVRAGQILAQQDVTDLGANVNTAQANVASAVSTLAQNVTNYQIQVIQAKANVQNAQAALRASQFAYSKAKQGSRPQQVLESQSSVEQAKATLENANTTLQRDKYLYSQGALAASDLDTAQTNAAVDQQQYQNAQAALSLTKAGNYTQDIASAQEQVREAQTSLVNQQASARQVQLHKQQIQAAQDAVTAAKATLSYDQQQVQFATVRSPFSGIVATRSAQPGQVASAGTALVEIVNVRTAYFEPTISESIFGSVNVGTPVSVRSDALPGRTFSGKVAAVYPAATAGTRTFSLRVNIPNPRSELRPGMFARGTLLTQVRRNVVVIPVSALLAQQQSGLAANTSSTGEASGGTELAQQQVFLVGPGGKAEAKPVTVGTVSGARAEITSGLRAGDRLITTGQGLVQPGQQVQVVGPQSDQTASGDGPGT